jgi:ADP-heptose:LPS heptosyltransferase
MKIAVSFHNGIGNFVIFTSVLQALQHYSGNPVTLVLDDDWTGEVRDGIELLANNMKFIDKVIRYPSEYYEGDYDLTYMSAHSVMSGDIYKNIYTDKPDPNNYTAWAASFLGELDFYYLELYRKLDYKGPIFPQYLPTYSDFEKSKFVYDLRVLEDTKIVVSNGWRRSRDNRMESKQYPHWAEVMQKIKELYDDVRFILVGGEDDREWAKGVGKLFPKETCLNLTGRTNLQETTAVLSASDLVLSSDTGTFHMADALGCPGIVVFSSTLYSKNYPINEVMVPIRSPLACAPCQSTILFQMCGENHRCAEAVSPKYVVAVTRKLLNERKYHEREV